MQRSFRSPISTSVLRPRTIRPVRASGARTTRYGGPSKTYEETVGERVEQARRAVGEIDEGEDAVQWRAAVDASKRELEEATAQLAKEGISDPSEYHALLEQASSLGREIKALRKEQNRVEELNKEAVVTLTDYRAQRSTLSKRRRRFATETSSDVIRVAIDPYANRGRLAEELVDILGIERFESDRQAIARRIQPEQGRPWSWEKLDEVVAAARQFLSGGLNSWPAQDHRFEAALKIVPPERIDRLALYLPDDAVEVRFKDRSARNWQPLTQGSPGQQTAALLAFVLGYGSEPNHSRSARGRPGQHPDLRVAGQQSAGNKDQAPSDRRHP